MGDAYPKALVKNPEQAGNAIQSDFFKILFGEVLGFAGACMIRRIVTIAQIADYTTIPDRAIRAVCAKRALKLGIMLLVDGKGDAKFPDMHSVIHMAKQIKSA